MPDTDEKNEQKDDPKSGFTQEQVNAFVAEERRAAKEQIKAATKERDDAVAAAAQAEEQRKALEGEASTAKLTATKFKVGLEAGLPLVVAERLQGEDEESLKSDAEALSALLPKSTDKTPEGRLPGPKAEPDKDTDFNDMIRAASGRA